MGDETTPLEAGNDNVAFNVDNTGIQALIPFNTLSNWRWYYDSLLTNGCIQNLSVALLLVIT